MVFIKHEIVTCPYCERSTSIRYTAAINTWMLHQLIPNIIYGYYFPCSSCNSSFHVITEILVLGRESTFTISTGLDKETKIKILNENGVIDNDLNPIDGLNPQSGADSCFSGISNERLCELLDFDNIFEEFKETVEVSTEPIKDISDADKLKIDDATRREIDQIMRSASSFRTIDDLMFNNLVKSEIEKRRPANPNVL